MIIRMMTIEVEYEELWVCGAPKIPARYDQKVSETSFYS